MAAGYTASANVAELIPELTERVDTIYQDNALGEMLVKVKDASNQPGKTVEFPIFTEVAASTGVAETATPTSHQMDIGMASLTVARRSILVYLSDLSDISSDQALVSEIGMRMGMAKAKAVDELIFGILTGTTDWATSAGATNGTLTLTHCLSGLLLLEKQEINEIPNIVLHPHQFGKGPRTALTPVANDDGASNIGVDALVRNAKFQGTWYGMNWYNSNRISSGTVDATANVYGGLLFAPSAIGYAVKEKVSGVEIQRESREASDSLVLNWFDSAGVIHTEDGSTYQGIAKLYSTSA